jgi:hypothetical protein
LYGRISGFCRRPCLPIDPTVEKFVSVVICALAAASASAAAVPDKGGLLQRAGRLSGLAAQRPVPTATFSGARYDALLGRALGREYPRALRRVDSQLYACLGLMPRSLRGQIATDTHASRAWYDPAGHRLLLRRAPAPARARVIHELVRALVDQNFNLRRLTGLRARDRDAAIAARAIVDGTAALASGLRASVPRGTPLDRFLQLEASAGLGPGRALAAELKYLGGRSALRTALRRFPQTTEQLLHIDKFLERERALPIRLPSRIGTTKLSASETFGELDVRNLLRALAVPNAAPTAAGWGGGRLALYLIPGGDTVAALVLRWDSPDDAAEWRAAVPRFVSAAFGDATPRDCPPLDRCWSGAAELAAGVFGDRSVLVSGPGAELVAANLLS